MRLFDGLSLLQVARERLRGVFAADQIWVITSAAYIDLVAAELPDVPRANLIGEPVGRDTANAIGLAAHLLAKRDPAATMAVFTADHLITPQDTFADTIRRGLAAAEQFPSALVTFGITPDRPETGYGYVHRGDEVAPGVRRVRAFKEKPSREIAAEYVASGDYAWNSGMFAWTLSAILSELQRRLPENDRLLAALAHDWERLPGTPELNSRFAELPKISIDFGVMEKAEQVLTVEMPCRWLDLGSWVAVGQTRTADDQGNVAVAPRALFVDSADSIVISEDPEHLVVTLGVRDLVVVHSADATLVCHREHVQQIKELAERRREHFGERYE